MSKEIGELGKKLQQAADAQGVELNLNDDNDGHDHEDARTEPGPDSPRFHQVYGNWKRSERKIADLEKKIEDLAGKSSQADDKALAALREHNQKLAEALEKMATSTTATNAAQVAATEAQTREAKLAQLKKDRIEARESLEWARVDELDDQILEMKFEMRQPNTPMPQPGNVDTVMPPKWQPDPQLNDFYKEFTWANPTAPNFNQNMLQMAAGFETALLADPSYQGSTEEAAMQAGRMVAEKMGLTKPASSGNIGGVEAPSNISEFGHVDHKTGSVKLSAEQAHVARMLMPDVPEQEAYKRYAKQLAMRA